MLTLDDGDRQRQSTHPARSASSQSWIDSAVSEPWRCPGIRTLSTPKESWAERADPDRDSTLYCPARRLSRKMASSPAPGTESPGWG